MTNIDVSQVKEAVHKTQSDTERRGREGDGNR